MMQTAVEWSRKINPQLVIGIRRGEQGGHSTSIRFCRRHRTGFRVLIPLRIPIARLAAVYAALAVRRQSAVI
ncbi:hypothetical protein ACR2R6_13460 [Methylocaldum gracile subsp. desertum]|uniref:hypothetical protein n=1 Tax=Methylocaldum sp. GT1BW TaxID=3438964 RepID=UPI003DA1A8A8